MDTYERYQMAHGVIRTRWLQGELHDHSGGGCLIGSLLARHETPRHLPLETVQEVCRQLRRYPLYHIARVLIVPGLLIVFDSESFWDKRWRMIRSVYSWNDAPWRRQKTVIRVIAKLEAKHETDWLRDKTRRQQVEISELRARIDKLRERLALVQDENRALWRRVIEQRSHAEDERTLARLEHELAEKWKELVA